MGKGDSRTCGSSQISDLANFYSKICLIGGRHNWYYWGQNDVEASRRLK